MGKKVNSKQMQTILKGLEQFDEFEIIVFTEDIIFKSSIEDWPVVDAMIMFYSDGFPFNKALNYLKLTNPFLINDFEIQKILWDRRKVLDLLQKGGIPIVRHIIVDRGEEVNNDGEFSHQKNNSDEIEEMIKAMKALEKNNISVRVKNIIYSSFQKGDKNESTVL